MISIYKTKFYILFRKVIDMYIHLVALCKGISYMIYIDRWLRCLYILRVLVWIKTFLRYRVACITKWSENVGVGDYVFRRSAPCSGKIFSFVIYPAIHTVTRSTNISVGEQRIMTIIIDRSSDSLYFAYIYILVKFS